MRNFMILMLFVVSLYSKNIKETLVENITVSIDGTTYKKIESIENFNQKVFTMKFDVNTTMLEDKSYYLRLMVESQYVKSSTYKYILKNNLPIFEINKNTPNEIFVDFDFKEELPLLQLNIFTQVEKEYLLSNEKLIYGLTYGVMFCALLYNLAFYYFNRQKSFLYYSLLQFFSINMLLIIAMPIKFFYLLFEYINIFDVVVDLIIVFSILFSMEFLNSKKLIPRVHKLLKLILLLTFIDIVVISFYEQTLLYEYIPTFTPVGIMVFSAFFVVGKENKPVIFYIVGWMVLFISIFLVDTDYFDVNEIYLLHFAFPIEALIFSFAIGYKFKLMELEKQQSEQLLVHQSKFASMGEMVANIAHQWRQPLTHLSYVNMNLKAAYDTKKLTSDYFDKKTNEINQQIEFMSNTINDFRNFFKTDKRIEKFGILESFESTYRLLNATFKHCSIEVKVKCEEEIFVNSYKSEFSQVIFNILNNSKQAIEEKKINNPKIVINIAEQNKKVVLKISDNALGIPKNIINNIFDPYFTTKEDGMGIGLYMSKVIIETHMKGKLEVKNIPNGVLFEISLPLIENVT